MRQIAEIIVGNGIKERMKKGAETYVVLDVYLKKLKAWESDTKNDIPVSHRIVTDRMMKTHETQKKHFENCLTPPPKSVYVVMDRFGSPNLTRGTGSLEHWWRELRAIYPEKCSLEFGNALLQASIVSWNIKRDHQYDGHSTSAYLPISSLYISLTQDFGLRSPSNINLVNGQQGIQTFFTLLPLALGDCDGEFGLTDSLLNAQPSLPCISEKQRESVNNSITRFDFCFNCANERFDKSVLPT